MAWPKYQEVPSLNISNINKATDDDRRLIYFKVRVYQALKTTTIATSATLFGEYGEYGEYVIAASCSQRCFSESDSCSVRLFRLCRHGRVDQKYIWLSGVPMHFNQTATTITAARSRSSPLGSSFGSARVHLIYVGKHIRAHIRVHIRVYITRALRSSSYEGSSMRSNPCKTC